MDALRAQNDGRTTEEVQFILAASAAGSINAKCPGCYTPAHIPKFSVGDQLCCDHEDIKHWFTRPRKITGITSSSYMTEGLQVPFDWDPYMHICTGEEKCIGIYCPDKCDGTSLYSQKCVNGVCVNDALIEANSTTCGYVPSDDEIYDEIDDDVTDDDVTDDTTNVAAIYCEESGYEYKTITDDEGVQRGICVFPDESSCDAWEFLAGTCEYDEDKGIFGDLDTKWIIIAVIGIIILGLLS
jgi:putative hemolysin